MNKEILSTRNAASMAVIFVSGSSLFTNVTEKSGNSPWASILLAMLLSAPLMLIYARLQLLYPGQHLFDMLIGVFGNIAGKLLSIFFVWYCLHLGSLVLRDFGEFTSTVALEDTPMLVPMLCVGLLCIWVVYAGIEVIGRSSKFWLLFTIGVAIFLQLLSIQKMEFHHIKPLLDASWTGIFSDAAGLFCFPFGEMVIFLGALHSLPRKGTAVKMFFSGLLVGGFFILLVTTRNLLVLGPQIMSALYFPAYVAVSRINVGDILTRIEGSSAVIFVIGLFIKTSLCLYVASAGTARVFNLKSYRAVVFQLGLLIVYLADFLFEDIMEMKNFSAFTYKVYAVPFQLLLPLILWIAGEIKEARSRSKKAAPQG